MYHEWSKYDQPNSFDPSFSVLSSKNSIMVLCSISLYYISLKISYSFEPNHLLFPFVSNKTPKFGGKNTKPGRFISPRYPYIRPKYTISTIPLTIGFQSSNMQFQHSSPSLSPVTWAFPLYSELMTSPHTFLGKILNK